MQIMGLHTYVLALWLAFDITKKAQAPSLIVKNNQL
jgi:hypothetical protein